MMNEKSQSEMQKCKSQCVDGDIEVGGWDRVIKACKVRRNRQSAIWIDSHGRY